MFSENLSLNKNTKHIPAASGDGGIQDCVHDRRKAKRGWQDKQAIACDNREVVMIQMMRALGATAVVVASCLGSQAVAQTKQLTLCWAAWDPANALV